jgi:MFS family permease
MSPPPEPEARRRLLTPEFRTLMLSSSVFFLGAGAQNALLPRFVVDVLGGTEVTAGVVMGSMAISALLTRVWFGRLGDRRGARRVLVLGAAFAASAMGVLAAFPSVPGAVAARLLIGAGAAAVVTASTLLSIQLAPEDRRSEAASYVLISFHVGMGLGPMGGEALLGQLPYGAVWLAIGATTAAGGVLATRLRHRPGDPHAEPGPLIHPSAVWPGVVTLFGVFAFNGFLMFVPLYAREVGLDQVGAVFMTASLTIVVVRLLFGRVPDAVGPIRAGTFALALTGIATGVVAYWNAPTGLFVGAVLLAGGLSLQSPSFIAIAVEGVRPAERGSAMATYTGFFDVANALIGPTFGLIASGLDYRSAFLTAGAMSLVALGILHGVVAPRWRAATRVTMPMNPSR